MDQLRKNLSQSYRVWVSIWLSHDVTLTKILSCFQMWQLDSFPDSNNVLICVLFDFCGCKNRFISSFLTNIIISALSNLMADIISTYKIKLQFFFIKIKGLQWNDNNSQLSLSSWKL